MNFGTQHALSGYKIMWLFVMFDLPTETKKQRKAAHDFRQSLLKDGFAMHQYSVYIRHCASQESMNVHIRRVNTLVPSEGSVSVMRVTDKQYGDILHFVGKKSEPLKETYVQLEFF